MFFVLFFLFVMSGYMRAMECDSGERKELLLKSLHHNKGFDTRKAVFDGSEPFYIVEPSDQPQRNHYDERNKGSEVSHLIFHYTVLNFERTMDTFTADKPDGRVSAHYVITEEESEGASSTDSVGNIPGGMIFQLVPEEKRAWHAGISHWNGKESLNHESIGIENVNRGFEESAMRKEWFRFDPAQIKALGKLSQYLVKKYEIASVNVVGHADIAPPRKHDPGILFPWEELYYEYGIGAWLENPDEQSINAEYLPEEKLPKGVSDAFLLTQLKKYGYKVDESGYNTPESQNVVRAFKAHFSQNQHPEAYNGTIGKEDMLWAWGLAAKYRKN